MKVVLINPYLKEEIHNLRFKKADNVVMPLGLCQIASTIEKHDFEVQIIDGQIECSSWNDFIKKIKLVNPILIGLPVVSSRAKEIKDLAKRIKKETNCKFICVGGPHVTVNPDYLLESSFDFGIRGDAEIPFSELAQLIKKNDLSFQNLKKINGLIFKHEDRLVIDKPFTLENLNILPFPKFDFVEDITIYHPCIVSYKRLPSVTIISSRGCSFSCSFCASGNKNVKWRPYSAEYVFEQINFLIKKHDIRDVWFFDDLFTLSKVRVRKFCNLIKKRNINLTWGCLSRVDCVDEPLIRTMKDAGCWLIGYGLESGSQEILDIMRKQFKLEKSVQAVRLTNKLGLKVKAYFMMGYPGENLESIKKTMNFAFSLPIDYASFYPVNVLPGTELMETHKAFGKVNSNAEGIVKYGKEIFVPTKLSKEFLLEYQRKATLKFYTRPSYLFRQLASIRSIDDIKKNIYGVMSLL